ncbi:hypothetical protein [Microbulbifer taiwanensis]|uniref:Uncharacterized protein n=1 Tax=Microbulbifer taiwanensis TaxID=986746 RepID=A0ABW1YRE0_9GAMM|nr:hypothetical protein [Microbulbifer taiwanensis]
MSYEVVFTGALRDGFSRRQGIEFLGRQFALGFAQIKHLLSGARRVVKRVPEREKAERVIRELWRGGWHAELQLGDRVLYRTDQSQDLNIEEAETNRHSNSRVSICLPPSWKPCSDLNPNAVFQAGERDRHHYIVILQQPRRDLPTSLSLANYGAAQLQQCLARVSAGQVVSGPEATEHVQGPACISEMSAQLNGPSIQYLVAHFQCPEYFYTIFLWCEQREFGEKKQEFLRIVESFREGGAEEVAEENGTGVLASV